MKSFSRWIKCSIFAIGIVAYILCCSMDVLANADTTEVDKEIASLQAKLEELEKKQATATTKVSECQGALDAANQVFLDGAYGFYEAMGSTDAINALNTCKYSSENHRGDVSDATSLDNMLNSIKWVTRCNEVRRIEGTDPQNGKPLNDLKINDYMMATAQADANYSDEIVAHASQFNVGECIAWGYQDPFDGWYYAEKQMYNNGVREFMEIGHYLNVTNSGYTVSGFSIKYTSMYNGTEHLQTYSYGNGYTVEEYTTRFMNYYNKVKQDINNASTVLTNANGELNDINSEITMTNEAIENAIAKRDGIIKAYEEEQRKKQESTTKATETSKKETTQTTASKDSTTSTVENTTGKIEETTADNTKTTQTNTNTNAVDETRESKTASESKADSDVNSNASSNASSVTRSTKKDGIPGFLKYLIGGFSLVALIALFLLIYKKKKK